MPSAEDVIRRHRERLEQHKQFLHKGGSGEMAGQGPSQRTSRRFHGTEGDVEEDEPTCRYDEDGYDEGEGIYEGHGSDQPRAAQRDQRQHGGPKQHRASQQYSPRSNRDDDRQLYSDGNTYYTDEPTRVFDRNSRWLQHRNHTIEMQRAEKSQEAVEGCTFRPNTNISGKRSTSPGVSQPRRSSTRDGSVPYYASVDDATTNHVLRQRQARRDKQESQSRASIDTSNWQPRTTEFKEFQFGQHNHGPISALRKPVAYGEAEEYDPAEHSPSPTMRNTNKRASPSASSSARATKGSSSSTNGTSNGRGGSSGGSKASLEAVQAMEKKIASQEMEIARLNGTVSSLKRELDVAKAKVRQMALAQQSANQFL